MACAWAVGDTPGARQAPTAPQEGKQSWEQGSEALLGGRKQPWEEGVPSDIVSLSWVSTEAPVALFKSFWRNSLIQGCLPGLGISFAEWSDILRALGLCCEC